MLDDAGERKMGWQFRGCLSSLRLLNGLSSIMPYRFPGTATISSLAMALCCTDSSLSITVV
jgi:hypothetical protein